MREQARIMIHSLQYKTNHKEPLLVGMGLQALYNASVILTTNNFVNDSSKHVLTLFDIGHTLIALVPDGPYLAALNKLITGFNTKEYVADIDPRLPQEELFGKLLIDLEIARAILECHGELLGKTALVDEILTEAKSNIPLLRLEAIEITATRALERYNTTYVA